VTRMLCRDPGPGLPARGSASPAWHPHGYEGWISGWNGRLVFWVQRFHQLSRRLHLSATEAAATISLLSRDRDGIDNTHRPTRPSQEIP